MCRTKTNVGRRVRRSEGVGEDQIAVYVQLEFVVRVPVDSDNGLDVVPFSNADAWAIGLAKCSPIPDACAHRIYVYSHAPVIKTAPQPRCYTGEINIVFDNDIHTANIHCGIPYRVVAVNGNCVALETTSVNRPARNGRRFFDPVIAYVDTFKVVGCQYLGKLQIPRRRRHHVGEGALLPVGLGTGSMNQPWNDSGRHELDLVSLDLDAFLAEVDRGDDLIHSDSKVNLTR